MSRRKILLAFGSLLAGTAIPIHALAFLETRAEKTLRESGIITLKQPFVPEKKVYRLLVSLVFDPKLPGCMRTIEDFERWANRDSDLFEFSLYPFAAQAEGLDGNEYQSIFFAAVSLSKAFEMPVAKALAKMVEQAKNRAPTQDDLIKALAEQGVSQNQMKEIFQIAGSFSVAKRVRSLNQDFDQSNITSGNVTIVGGRAGFSSVNAARQYMEKTLAGLLERKKGSEGNPKK